ncbi:SDR family oxidoreductase [Lachancea thermotolerans CBS 6340]|uniref:KLTH0E09680p n=1 Tax=Lachancea thermotolerans (strain ATCC 56472 / CBS 6340 / NRRL Y-8284) TaxID=559295 RepID=C5DI48_LACTC|nr:KLTH0E09680p [Lachancea thermotolerans CBS 6340]CAR23459.1 KLTH0E09680p [Lachancea thermotolerans CBS 6340]
MDEKVLVTGCNGFIALHVLDVLLSEKYHVIGTARSQDKADQVKESFKKLYPYAQLEVEIVPDITKSGAFNDVFKKYPDIQHVLHTASNFSFGHDQSTEEAYLIPATQGTKNILETSLTLGKKVKRFVITSSFASIMDFDHEGDANFIHTEATWNPTTWEKAKGNELSAYIASKKLAEESAWTFMKKHESEVPFTLTTVCPPYVWGPQMFDSSVKRGVLNTSAELINQALKTTPDFKGPFDTPNGIGCDVRDVALLHVLPLRNEKLAGKRLFPVNGTGVKQHNYKNARFNMQRVLDVLNKKFPELRGKISKGGIEDNEKALAAGFYYNNDETCKLTGIEFKPLEVTIHDAAKQILEFGSSD